MIVVKYPTNIFDIRIIIDENNNVERKAIYHTESNSSVCLINKYEIETGYIAVELSKQGKHIISKHIIVEVTDTPKPREI